MDSTDASVTAPEVQRRAVWLIGSFGVVSAAFGLAAEMGRVKTFQLAANENGEQQCQYPASSSFAFAMAAIFSLIIAQVSGFLCGSFAWCPRFRTSSSCSNSRLAVAVALVAQLVFAATAAATYITAALRNASLPSTPLAVTDTNQPQCLLLDNGVFLTGAVLSLFATVLIEAYYYLSIGLLREMWVDAYSAGPLDGLEMLSNDASAVRISGRKPLSDEEVDDFEDVLGDGDYMASDRKDDSGRS